MCHTGKFAFESFLSGHFQKKTFQCDMGLSMGDQQDKLYM